MCDLPTQPSTLVSQAVTHTAHRLPHARTLSPGLRPPKLSQAGLPNVATLRTLFAELWQTG